MKKINILFVIPQLEKGGSESLVYEIASRLDRNIFSSSVAYFKYYGNESFQKAFQNHDIRLYHIPINNTVDISAMQRMANIIRDYCIDVVNAHHFVSMVYSIYTEHSSWEVDNVTLKWLLLGRMLIHQLDCVTGISDDVTNALRSKYHINEKKVLAINNGVSLEGIKMTRTARAIRDEFGISDDVKIIASVANFRRVKNHLFLLRGFKELVKEFGNVKLLLVGQGTENDSENTEINVRSYVKENGLLEKVILTGHRNDVRELLSIADVFCLTSYREGLPISMLEAMSTGLPVVGTNVPGIRDVIMNGENGYLVESDDHMSLKKALAILLTNRKIQLSFGQKSINIVNERYSMNECMKAYQDLFQRLVRC